MAGQAVVAVAAEDRQAAIDVVARLHVRRPGRRPLRRSPAASWPRIAGAGCGYEPIDEVQVAVADAAGDGAHENLAAQRLVDRPRLRWSGAGSRRGTLLLSCRCVRRRVGRRHLIRRRPGRSPDGWRAPGYRVANSTRVLGAFRSKTPILENRGIVLDLAVFVVQPVAAARARTSRTSSWCAPRPMMCARS